MTDIGKLKDLEAKATPGPWDVVDPEDDLIHIVYIDGDADDQAGLVLSSTNVAFVSDTVDDEANAHLIAALRNAAPSLIARLKAAERLIALLRAYTNDLNENGSTEMFPGLSAAMHAYDNPVKEST